MSIRKRIPVLLTGLLLALTALFGCASGKDAGAEGKSGTESGFQKKYVPSEFTQADVESDTVQWFCSAYAIYTQHNNKDLGMIGGTSPENKEMHERAIKEALDSGWGITSHRSAVNKVNKLLSGGHREKYREMIADMKEDGLLDLPEEEMEETVYQTVDEDDISEYFCAYHAYHEFGENALDGWDYCRALQVLGDCYQVDYISLEECLDESLIVAKKLKGTFANWEDMCKSYLYGYYFWGHDSVDTEWRWGIYEELNAMVDGPYKIPYDTELKENWKGVKGKSTEDSGEDTLQGEGFDGAEGGFGETTYVPKTDEKGRYILPADDGEKEFVIGVPDGYECDTEWSAEDEVAFDYKVSEGDPGIYYASISYYAEKADPGSDDSMTLLVESNESSWKENTLYKEVRYSGVMETKVGDHTVKYCSLCGLYDTAQSKCDRQWAAWFETKDGYRVYCLAFETTDDAKPETVSEKTVQTFMSQVSER